MLYMWASTRKPGFDPFPVFFSMRIFVKFIISCGYVKEELERLEYDSLETRPYAGRHFMTSHREEGLVSRLRIRLVYDILQSLRSLQPFEASESDVPTASYRRK